MGFHRFFRVVFLLLIWIACPALLQAEEIVRIGVLAKRGAEHTLNRWQPTADYLGHEIPGYQFIVVPLDFEQTDRLAEDKVEFILANSAIYVGLEMHYGVSRIATIINRNGGGGYTQFGGVILTRADRTDIRQIGDMAGKRFSAVDENSLGGFLMAWREMEQQGVSPYKKTTLNFLGTHDEVVYAVRDGRTDVGTVRTDTLERMQNEGKIKLSQFKIINPQYHDGFAYLCSTRLYPEWPLAKLHRTSEGLSNAVVAALLRMQANNPAAVVAELAGWTVPRNYQPVHELLRELRVSPYADLGKITLKNLLINYWHWLLLLCATLIILSITVLYVTRLNLRLRKAENELIEARDNLVQKVRERTKELEESQQRLERISKDWNDAFDAIADPIFIHDREMRIVQANPAYCERAGHTLAEMVGQRYYEVFPRLEQPLPSCLEVHENLQPEGNELQLPGGEIFISRSFSIFRADQTTSHAIHILEDVTAVRHAEAQRQTLSRALEQAGEGAMIFSAERRVLYCNPALRQLSKISGDEDYKSRDISIEDIVSKYFNQQLQEMFETAERGQNASGEIELVSNGVEKRPAFITVSCIKNDSGENDGYVMTVLDLTKLRHAEEALTYRIALESMIAGIASRLVNIDVKTIDREINEAFLKIGEFAAVDRVYLFHYDAQSDTISNTHEWCAPEIKPRKDQRQELSLAQLPWLREELLTKREVIVSDVTGLPDAAAAEGENFLGAGVLSQLLVPLRDDGTLSGFIGFDNIQEARTWTATDTYLPRLVGEIIINSLARVRTMVSLQHSQATLAAAQKIVHLGNWEWDITTNALFWSDEAYRIFGLTPQLFSTTFDAFLQIVHPDDRDYVISELSKGVAGEKDYVIDHRIVQPNGTVKIVHEIGQTDIDETGKVRQMIGTVQDVTQLRQTEQEMKRLNRALRALSKCNTTLVHACDEQTLMVDICHILIESGYRFAWVGYAHTDAGPKIHPVASAGYEHGFINAIDLTWTDDDSGKNPAGYAIRSKEPFIARDIAAMVDIYQPWRKAALEQGYLSVVALPLISADEVFGVITIDASEPDAFDERELLLLVEMAGDLAYGIRTLRNREQRLRAEQELRESEIRYEELYEKAPNGYVSISVKDGSLLQFNQALCDILGYKREVLSGKRILDLYADSTDGKPRAREMFKRFTRGERIRDAELQMCHADGHPVWVSISVEPVKDAQGTVQESRASITDISARKQAVVEQQRFAKQLQTSLLQTIRAIALTIEKRDPYTAGHQERVADLAVKIGECMGFDAQRLEGLHLGAMIHDIGKISVPAEILNRPGTLEPMLFTILKAHPAIGYDIIKEIDFPWPLADMVLHHHEHLDGSGYPDGLKGDEISLESRILVVADVVEAMASHRPYRPARGNTLALEEIEQGKGTLYDPEVVECCLKLFHEHGSPWSDSA